MTVKALFGSGIDSTPDQFTFTDVSGINPSTVTTSGTVTVTGLSPNIPINVTASGGTVDVGTSSLSGTYDTSKSVTTSSTGTFVMAARATSSPSYSASVNVTVTVNGVSDTFTVTTRAADTTPSQFYITDTSSAEINTVYSSLATPTDYDYANWSVSGGEGNNGVGWSTSGTIYSGQSLYVRGTSSGSFSTPVNVNVNIGGVSDTYTITTRAVDTTPDAFSFSSQYNVAIGTTCYSNQVTVTGLDPNISITVYASNGYVDAGTYGLSGSSSSQKTVTTSSSGTIVIQANLYSGGSYSSSATCTVSIGSTVGYFTVYTIAADTTPDAFYFTDQSNVELSTTYTSNAVYVYGFSPNYYPITVTASGGSVSAGTYGVSGSYSSTQTVTSSPSGYIVVQAQVTSSGSNSTASNCTVNINGVSDTFTVTTKAPAPVGEAVFTSGNYVWQAPAGVTSVCVVCLNANLAWSNNISVTPGSYYGVNVSQGDYSQFTGASTFVRASGQYSGYGSGIVGDGGGYHGYPRYPNMLNDGSGGGGDGGYTGNGGNGGAAYNPGGSGSGGAGGGGGGGGSPYPDGEGGTIWGLPPSYGGGTGVYGQGASGAGGAVGQMGGAGSGGYAWSGQAKVRIIWGPGRSFPYNAS